jgi:hypothetical protein
MKIFLSTILCVFILLFMGCGEKAQEMKNAMEIIKNAPNMADKAQKGMDRAKQLREDRIKRGDTLAMNFKKLQEYLPKSLDGYKAEEPSGESSAFGSYSFSRAGIRFVKDKSDGSQDYVEIELLDYNQAAELYAGLTFWSAGISVENKDGWEKTFDTKIEWGFGYEKYHKPNNSAEVSYALGYRFLLSVKANNQSNTDFVRRTAESLKLKELANM